MRAGRSQDIEQHIKNCPMGDAPLRDLMEKQAQRFEKEGSFFLTGSFICGMVSVIAALAYSTFFPLLATVFSLLTCLIATDVIQVARNVQHLCSSDFSFQSVEIFDNYPTCPASHLKHLVIFGEKKLSKNSAKQGALSKKVRLSLAELLRKCLCPSASSWVTLPRLYRKIFFATNPKTWHPGMFDPSLPA